MTERITLIFGKTGTGKTTFAKSIVKNEQRLICIDPLAEFDYEVFTDFESAYNYLTVNETFKVSIRFTNDLDFEYLFKLIFELENITLLLEEAEIYISPSVRSSEFLRLVRYGRHRKINIVGIARRSAELSRDFRSQTNRIVSFKQTDIIDLKNLELLGLSNLDNLNEHEYKEVFF